MLLRGSRAAQGQCDSRGLTIVTGGDPALPPSPGHCSYSQASASPLCPLIGAASWPGLAPSLLDPGAAGICDSQRSP